jgi:hypothetical protein
MHPDPADTDVRRPLDEARKIDRCQRIEREFCAVAPAERAR